MVRPNIKLSWNAVEYSDHRIRNSSRPPLQNAAFTNTGRLHFCLLQTLIILYAISNLKTLIIRLFHASTISTSHIRNAVKTCPPHQRRFHRTDMPPTTSTTALCQSSITMARDKPHHRSSHTSTPLPQRTRRSPITLLC